MAMRPNYDDWCFQHNSPYWHCHCSRQMIAARQQMGGFADSQQQIETFRQMMLNDEVCQRCASHVTKCTCHQREPANACDSDRQASSGLTNGQKKLLLLR